MTAGRVADGFLEAELSSVEHAEHVPLSYVLRQLAAASFPRRLLSAALTKYDGLEVDDFLSAFEALHSLAKAFLEKRIEFSDSMSSILAVDAPCVSKGSCIDLVAKACGFQRSKAKVIVDGLTLDGEGGGGRDGAWFRPLVPANADHLYIVCSVLMTTSPRRLIDYWLRMGGYPNKEKGDALEQIARDRLAHAVNENPMHLDGHVHPRSRRYEGNKGPEIDALVRVGRIVLVCEVKCVIEPVTAMELNNFSEKVLEGVKQVAKELAMAERHRKTVADDTEYHDDPATLTLAPFVLVNTGVASGMTIDGVPVLDTSILEEYFESGTLSFIFEDPISAPRETITLYRNQHEAEANLQSYVFSPPRERLRQLRTKKITRPSRNWGFGTIVYERFEISEYTTLTDMQTAVDLVRQEWKDKTTGRQDL